MGQSSQFLDQARLDYRAETWRLTRSFPSEKKGIEKQLETTALEPGNVAQKYLPPVFLPWIPVQEILISKVKMEDVVLASRFWQLLATWTITRCLSLWPGQLSFWFHVDLCSLPCCWNPLWCRARDLPDVLMPIPYQTGGRPVRKRTAKKADDGRLIHSRAESLLVSRWESLIRKKILTSPMGVHRGEKQN